MKYSFAIILAAACLAIAFAQESQDENKAACRQVIDDCIKEYNERDGGILGMFSAVKKCVELKPITQCTPAAKDLAKQIHDRIWEFINENIGK